MKKQTKPIYTRTDVLVLEPAEESQGKLPSLDRLASLFDPTGGCFVGKDGHIVFDGLGVHAIVGDDHVRFEAQLADGWYDEEHDEWHGEDEDADDANAAAYEAIEAAGVTLQRLLRWEATHDVRGVCDAVAECAACDGPIFAWEEDADECALCGASRDDEDDEDEAVDEAPQVCTTLAELVGPPLDEDRVATLGELLTQRFQANRSGRDDGHRFWLATIARDHDVRLELGPGALIVRLYSPRAKKDLPPIVYDRAGVLVRALQRLTRYPLKRSDWLFRGDFGVARAACKGCKSSAFGWEKRCVGCGAALPEPHVSRTSFLAERLIDALIEAEEIEPRREGDEEILEDTDRLVQWVADALEDPRTTASSLLAVLEEADEVEEVFLDADALRARIDALRLDVTDRARPPDPPYGQPQRLRQRRERRVARGDHDDDRAFPLARLALDPSPVRLVQRIVPPRHLRESPPQITPRCDVSHTVDPRVREAHQEVDQGGQLALERCRHRPDRHRGLLEP